MTRTTWAPIAIMLATGAACASTGSGTAGGNYGTSGCPIQGCGSNTPELSASTFVESLNLQGLPNVNGVSVDLESISACNGTRRLRVVGGAIEAFDPNDPSKVCSGQGLVGAVFFVTAPHSVRRGIRIQAVDAVATWHVTGATEVPSYRLEWSQTGTRWTPMCPLRRMTWMERWQSESGRLPKSDPKWLKWHSQTDHALIVQGETYLPTGDVDVSRSGPDWINIACAGAAFAKMRLLGFDPMNDPSDAARAERIATLRMITARYAGDDHAYTEQGVPLAWKSASNVQYYGAPDPKRVGPVEATWNQSGATCVSHSRLWRRTDSRFSQHVDQERTRFSMPPACSSAFDDPATAVPQGRIWMTHTVDHVRHPTGAQPPLPVVTR